MKRTLAILLILALLPILGAASLAEEAGADMSLEAQLIRMNALVSEAIACREAGNWAEEAAILETIVAMNDAGAANPEWPHNEIAWPAQARWAHYQLGELYSHEAYGLFNIDQAIEHYAQAAGPLYRGQDSDAEVNTHSMAALALGDIYLSGDYGRMDVDKAVEYLEKEAGIPDGNFISWCARELLELYADPEYGPRADKAAALYKLSYERGNTRNLYNLAKLYLDEECDIADEAQGIYWMYQSAAHGDSRAIEWFEQLLPADDAEEAEPEQ